MATKKETSPTKALAPIKTRVKSMTGFVESLEITDTVTLKKAIAIRSGIKDVAKQVKAWKDDRIKPLQESIALLRDDVRPLELACEEATEIVDKKMLDYNRVVEANRKKEEDKINAKVDAGKMSIETASKKLEVVPEVQTSVKADKGQVSFKKVKNFRVVDLSKVPIEFHLADTGAIRKQMYAGIELPGVEYFEEDQVAGR